MSRGACWCYGLILLYPLPGCCRTFAEGPLPLRLCYGGEIFAMPAVSRANSALTQAGVELMGDATPGSDAEVVVLAAAVLQEAS